MLAIDTNVLVRIATLDDPQQAIRAVKLLAKKDIFISKTVLLETEWVLRYVYQKDREAVLQALQHFVGLPNTTIETPWEVAQALEWFESGLDFADALHLAACMKTADSFASFDEKFCKKASKLAKINFSFINLSVK